MVTIERTSPASPVEVWELLARPNRWHDWAPHVFGAWGLGSPEVQEGRRGFVRLLGAAPVPARILEVERERSWSWRVAGLVVMDHRVEPLPAGGSRIAIDLSGPGPLTPVLAGVYGPLVGWLIERLADRAAG